MYVLDGGLVSPAYTSVVALHKNSNGYLTVSGVNQTTGDASTFRVVHNQFWVGDGGRGTVGVSDGGLVEVGDGILVGGEFSTGVGLLLVDGVNEASGIRSAVNSNTLSVGYNGTGTAFVTNGSIVNTNVITIVRHDNSNGNLYISGINAKIGDRSTINVTQDANI